MKDKIQELIDCYMQETESIAKPIEETCSYGYTVGQRDAYQSVIEDLLDLLAEGGESHE